MDALESDSRGAVPVSKRAKVMQGIQRCRKFLASGLAATAFYAATSTPAFAARPAPPEEPKGRIEISFDGEPRELTSTEKTICGIISAAAAGGLLYWGKVSGDQEEREEEKRIKAETERLNKVRDEFLMDEEVVKDDDLFSSLRKRMEKTGGAGGAGSDQPGSGPEGSGPEGPSGGLDDQPPPPPPPATSDPPRPRKPTGPSAVKPPPESPPPAKSGPAGDDDPAARDADIERLKRMFGTDGSK